MTTPEPRREPIYCDSCYQGILVDEDDDPAGLCPVCAGTGIVGWRAA